MSSKHKKPGKPATASDGGELARETIRLIEKQRYKDAVKQAKLAFRQSGTPENRRLLERSYFLRAEQLHQARMPESAREVAGHLIEFGVTDPDLVEKFSRLLMVLGQAREAKAFGARLESPAAMTRLLTAAADAAVAHPERTSADLPEIRQGALLVRAALESLEAGDEERALSGLREIARGSPFADWRLFVRGLAASYRRDLDERKANWDRLDPDRAASRIARAVVGLGGGMNDLPAGPKLRVLETRVFGEPILENLQQIRDLVAVDNWRDALRALSNSRATLRRVAPELLERVTRMLYGPIIKRASGSPFREGTDLIERFIKAAEPLPIDPRWNRLRALTWEGASGELAAVEEYWLAYVKDLENLPALRPEERPLAQALVWRHLGELYVDESTPDDNLFAPRTPARELKRAKTRAIECLEESLRLYPAHKDTYIDLREAYEDWDEPDKAEEVALRLLAAFPDDYVTLAGLVTRHIQRDDSIGALEYARRARRLKPLDAGAAGMEYAALVGAARQHALKKRWDEGRAAFAAAEPIKPASIPSYALLVRRAVFELKARQTEPGEALIARALGEFEDPTPVWLALTIEAVRYKLPKAQKDRFVAEWTAGLKQKAIGATAGAMASTLSAFVASDLKYTGRATHVREVSAYIKKAAKVKFSREDLRSVCEFLAILRDQKTLLGTLAKRGLKEFPDDPLFNLSAGATEFEKGPYRCNLYVTRKHLERALDLASKSNDPNDAALVPKVKEILASLPDADSSPFGFPFGFGFGRRGAGPSPARMFDPGDLFEDFDDEFDDEMDEEEDFDAVPEPPRRTGRRPKPKKR